MERRFRLTDPDAPSEPIGSCEIELQVGPDPADMITVPCSTTIRPAPEGNGFYLLRIVSDDIPTDQMGIEEPLAEELSDQRRVNLGWISPISASPGSGAPPATAKQHGADTQSSTKRPD